VIKARLEGGVEVRLSPRLAGSCPRSSVPWRGRLPAARRPAPRSRPLRCRRTQTGTALRHSAIWFDRRLRGGSCSILSSTVIAGIAERARIAHRWVTPFRRARGPRRAMSPFPRIVGLRSAPV
jgi:hypothetical protein